MGTHRKEHLVLTGVESGGASWRTHHLARTLKEEQDRTGKALQGDGGMGVRCRSGNVAEL